MTPRRQTAGRPIELRTKMTAAELRQWAEEHKVAHWLDLTLETALRGRIERSAYWWMLRAPTQKKHTLATALQAPEVRGYSFTARGVPQMVKDLVVRVLQDAVRGVQAGLADEERRFRKLRPPPEGSARRLLWDHVRALREQVRPHTQPRELRPQLHSALQLVLEPPGVQFREHGVTAICGGGVESPLLNIDLGDLSGAGATVSCSCDSDRRGRCSLALTTVDLTLEALADPTRAQHLEDFARDVTAPPWQRLLRRLDEVLPTRQKAGLPTELEIGWALSRAPGRPGPALTALRCRPYKRRSGYLRHRIDLGEVHLFPEASGQDRDVAAALPIVERYSLGGEATAARTMHALSLLAGHPRVFFEDGIEPWTVQRAELGLRCTRTPAGRLRFVLSFGGLEMSIRRLAGSSRLWHAGQHLAWLDPDGRRCLVLPCSPERKRLLDVLSSSPDELDAQVLPALWERWARLEEVLPLQLAPELRGREVEPSFKLRLQLELLPGGGLLVEARVQPLPAGQSWPPGSGPEEVYGRENGEPVYARRRLAEEREQARLALAGLPLPEAAVEPGQESTWRIEAQEPALELLLALHEAQAQGRLELFWSQDRSLRLTRPAVASDLRMHVSQHRDWLGLHGTLEVDGVQVPLEALLQAVREGRRFVRVDERLFVQLERHLIEQLKQAGEGVFERRGQLEVSVLHAPVFQDLTEAGASLEAPARWTQLLHGLTQAGSVETKLPRGLKAKLRPYQKTGYQWLARLAEWSPGACLADDMGLGKTVQALALLLRRQRLGPALVVAPTSVNHNWLREAERFAPGLNPVMYRGPDRQALLSDLKPGDLLITSYGLLVRDAQALSGRVFATVVWDEAQAMKNAASKRAKVATGIQGRFHVALTGTPVENRTAELWSLFRVLLPGLLGSEEQFRERFVLPIERDANVQRRQSLSRIVRPFVLRRHKSEVERELPERTEVELQVALSPEERQLYEQVRLQAIVQLSSAEGPDQQRRFQVLAALTRLRQIACHPRLYQEQWSGSSAKIDTLRELIAQLRDEGHRALVFSQFTSLLDLARTALEQDGVKTLTLQGSTPEPRRRELVDEFQAGGGDVFLISLRAGGVGLNLTAATYVVLLDPWWNPAVESQAADRTHRIGQTRPVTVYRLIAKGTIEEAIVELQVQKRELVQGLLEGTGSAEKLSTDELLQLMRQALAPED